MQPEYSQDITTYTTRDAIAQAIHQSSPAILTDYLPPNIVGYIAEQLRSDPIKREYYAKMFPVLWSAMDYVHMPETVKQDLAMAIATPETYPMHVDIAKTRDFIPSLVYAFVQLGKDNIPCDATLTHLLFQSSTYMQFAPQNGQHAQLLKIVEIAKRYALAQNVSLAIEKKATEPQRALPFSEIESQHISRKLFETISEKTHGDICIDLRSKDITTTKANGESHITQVEYFSSGEQHPQFVRVGNIFFIDQAYKDDLPKEFQILHNRNFIFADLSETELQSSLGYYMTNTLASLQACDLHDTTIIDCGAGTCLLSLAAVRLGAQEVIAIDIDRTLRNKAAEILYANQADDWVTFIRQDLQNFHRIIGFLPNDTHKVLLLSNIGSWSNYTITNVTSLQLAKEIEEAKHIPISTIICSGYDQSRTSQTHYPHEDAFLQELAIPPIVSDTTPNRYDQVVLEKMGYRQMAVSQSQPYARNLTIRHAASALFTR